MALKKSELYSSLWASCDELRGGMDASQYKDYVLVLLFVKYVSDPYADEPNAPITIPKWCKLCRYGQGQGQKRHRRSGEQEDSRTSLPGEPPFRPAGFRRSDKTWQRQGDGGP